MSLPTTGSASTHRKKPYQAWGRSSHSDYPLWYCPVFGCSYRTRYSKNIEKHLISVHDWIEEEADGEVSHFFKNRNKDVICSKSLSDPCYPHLSLTEGRRSRSVCSGGGDGG